VALERPPGLVLLDLNLPGLDGVEVCRQLRRNPGTSTVPIIMLTARVDESQKIAGLDVGADDYITKPFSMKELLARVRAVLRRTERGQVAEEFLTAGPITADLEGRRVRVDDVEVELTRKEFDLLVALMRNRGRVLTRDRLLEQVWEYEYPGETRTVDVHVRRLRQKLGESARECIETVVGVGYRLRSDR
jgi:DNA-binding response OmpR family regulator